MKVIGTTEISYEIEQLLDGTEKYLILVSPYLKLNNRLKVRLSDTFKKVDTIFLLYRENKVDNKELSWLGSFNSVTLYSIKNLHSKIYINEKTTLISSMNLYEYSQINNHEIGVIFDSNDDQNEYKDSLNEVRIMFESEGYTNDIFTQIVNRKEDYSMRKLFSLLNKEYTFNGFNTGSQHLYELISDRAREIVKFNDSELYQDNTAILRSTDLGKKRYKVLEKKLKELASNIRR